MIIEKEGKQLSVSEFEALTGARWEPNLVFEKKVPRCRQERKQEALWLGAYFQKEWRGAKESDLAIRWIDPFLGWGVFALRPLKKMEYIAEYSGKLRRRWWWEGKKNAYCFEYAAHPSYTVDALEQGGVGRYLNHSDAPNLESGLALFDGVCHIIFYTNKPIAEGEQLCYDYGPAYWSKRPKPVPL